MAELTVDAANRLVAQGSTLPSGWGYNAVLGAHKTESAEESERLAAERAGEMRLETRQAERDAAIEAASAAAEPDAPATTTPPAPTAATRNVQVGQTTGGASNE